MSIIIIFIFLLLLIIVRKIHFNDALSKGLLSIYIIEWWYATFFSRFNINDMRSIDEEVTNLLILHVLMFILGFILFSMQNKKNPTRVNEQSVFSLEKKVQEFMDHKLFIITLIISTIYVLGKFAIFYKQVVVLNAMSDVRDAYYSSEMYGADFTIINGLLLNPMNTICSILWSYALFRKRNWVFVIMTIFLFANNSLAGGRFGYAIIGIYFVLIIILLNIKIIKYWPIISIVLVFAYLTISYITAVRVEGDSEISWDNIYHHGIEETNKQILSYSTGPVAAFNVSYEEDFPSQIGGYKHGGLMCAPIIQMAYIVLNKIGSPFHQPIFDYAERIQDQWIDIGSGPWNALYTSVNFYYLDSGIFGVVVYPFIFGLIFCWIIRLFHKTQSIWHLFLLGFVCQMVFFSIFNYSFFTAFSLLEACAFYYMGKREKRVMVNTTIN